MEPMMDDIRFNNIQKRSGWPFNSNSNQNPEATAQVYANW